MNQPNTQTETTTTLSPAERESFKAMSQAIMEGVDMAWGTRLAAMEKTLAGLNAGVPSSMSADIQRVEALLHRAENLRALAPAPAPEPAPWAATMEDMLHRAEVQNMGFIARQVHNVKVTPTGSKVILISAGVAVGVGATLGTVYAVNKYRDHKSRKAAAFLDATPGSSEFSTGI